uniref:C2H2-type domain-containing protein n=1 Tax=Trichogramma kaykai TaxID=54128 RepID=A0ABD2W6U7_9HYME
MSSESESKRQKSHIKGHIIRVHLSESFNCDICDKSFKQESRLKTHLNNIHYPSKSFKCDICNKLYSSRSALKKHTNSKHKQDVFTHGVYQILKKNRPMHTLRRSRPPVYTRPRADKIETIAGSGNIVAQELAAATRRIQAAREKSFIGPFART